MLTFYCFFVHIMRTTYIHPLSPPFPFLRGLCFFCWRLPNVSPRIGTILAQKNVPKAPKLNLILKYNSGLSKCHFFSRICSTRWHPLITFIITSSLSYAPPLSGFFYWVRKKSAQLKIDSWKYIRSWLIMQSFDLLGQSLTFESGHSWSFLCNLPSWILWFL